MTWGGAWEEVVRLRGELDTGLLDVYAGEIERWNRRVRLVGPRDSAGIRVQIVDALVPYLRRPPCFPLVDVGSGAGLPGIPVAVAFPGEAVTCLEARGKRVSFLRHAVRVLGLRNVEVIHGRVEPGRTEGGIQGRFATVTARAVGDVRGLLAVAAGLLATGGQVYLPRGPADSPEVAGWRIVAEDRYEGARPLGPRCLLVYERGEARGAIAPGEGPGE